MYYVGSHKGHPDDGYTHSSSVMESFTMDNKPSYMKRRIILFGALSEMRELEWKYLRKVRNRSDYYNCNGIPMKDEYAAKGGRNNRGKPKSLEHRRKISEANKGQNASFHNLTNEQSEKHIQGCMGNKNFDISKPKTRHNHRNGMLKYWEDVKAGRVKRKGYIPNVS